MFRTAFQITLILSLSAGCVIHESNESDLAVNNAAVISWNVISWNVISWNVISWNSIAANEISGNALATSRLNGNELQYRTLPNPIKETAEGRQLIEYLARCSLAPGDILVVEHDGTTYEYPGLLALAPTWETQALTGTQRSLISACLIAHINALGESVPISTRAFGVLEADSGEILDFPVYEGTFFGQVFESDQKMYSCQGDSEKVARTQSPDRARRLCTDDTAACAVVALGRCRDICERRDAKYGWTDCWANGVRYQETLSVFLSRDNGSDTQTCGADGVCAVNCSGGDCTGHIDCQDSANCSAQCTDKATCNVDCNGAATCSQATTNVPNATGRTTMELDCQLTSTCSSVCTGASDCEIDCGGATQCTGIECTGQSKCLLDCTDAISCGFSVCEGIEQTCPGDIVVCNRPCP